MPFLLLLAYLVCTNFGAQGLHFEKYIKCYALQMETVCIIQKCLFDFYAQLSPLFKA